MEEAKQNILHLVGVRGPAGRPETTGLFVQEGGTTYDLNVFYDVFLESNDPTCRSFAITAFTEVPERGRWKEFLRMMVNPKFAKWIEEWQEDLEIKMRSEAILKISSGNYDPKDFTRLKWLAEGRASNKPTMGAPTKETKDKRKRLNKGMRGMNPNAGSVL